MNVVKLAIPEPHKPLVEELEKILQEAKEGHCKGMLMVKFKTDGCFAVKRMGLMSDLELIGAMTFAQYDVIEANKPK